MNPVQNELAVNVFASHSARNNPVNMATQNQENGLGPVLCNPFNASIAVITIIAKHDKIVR
jgi:hypothetical protein